MNSVNLKGSIMRYNWIRHTLLSGIMLNCTEIADHLGCTTKTAQRYIDRLRKDGYSVEYDVKLNGFVMREPRKKPIRQSSLYQTLRRAYAWTLKHHSAAPWLKEAEKVLRQSK